MTSDPRLPVPGPAHDAGPAPHAPSRLPAPPRLAHPFSPGVLALVFGGGVLGALSRWALGAAIPTPGGWPLGTLAINLVGALALGALLESLARRGPDVGPRRLVRLTVGTGFLGAFTTYSTLAVDGSRLLAAGRTSDGAWYLALSLLGGAAATLLGVAGAAWLHREDRRGLAAEAHAAAHPHGGRAHPAAPAADASRETASPFGQDHRLQRGAMTETGGGIGDRAAADGQDLPEEPR
ncbi:CrcB protein [Sinomonas atrocyanea]|uniref:fluoride efflux transporter FluC n=1 Tax=Sinomonas atrocyanea TaxID=37927 RepID=UPI00278AC5B7|nr:CrcB family protein [Sinomonas atrocyanea]MDP9884134.1 CrcB protein [Sinomonas atrocyanea]